MLHSNNGKGSFLMTKYRLIKPLLSNPSHFLKNLHLKNYAAFEISPIIKRVNQMKLFQNLGRRISFNKLIINNLPAF